MKKNQALIGIILLAVMVLFGFYLNQRGANLPMSLITGLGLGYILARSRYGFAGGIKRIYLSKETYHKLFVERWSFLTGGVLIAMMFLFIMNTTGSSWGASGPYTMWGIWLLQKIGISFSSPAFEGIVKSGCS